MKKVQEMIKDNNNMGRFKLSCLNYKKDNCFLAKRVFRIVNKILNDEKINNTKINNIRENYQNERNNIRENYQNERKKIL